MIVSPLFETWCEFLPSLLDQLITEGLEPNRHMLNQKIDETRSMADT